MLKAYTYKLSEEQLEVLQEAFSESYGEALVTLEELTKKNYKSKIKLSNRDSAVVGVFINQELNYEDKDEKVLVVNTTNTLISYLNQILDLNIALKEEVKEETTPTVSARELELEQVIQAKEGIIANYKQIIEELREQLSDLENSPVSIVDNSKYDKLKADYDNLKGILLKKEETLTKLNESYLALQERVSNQNIVISSLEKESQENKVLQERIKSFEDSSINSESVENLKKEIESITKDYEQSQNTITLLNQDKLTLVEELNKLKVAQENSKDTLDWMTKAGKAERELENFLKSPFGELYTASESNGVFFLKNSLPKFNNIKFLFTVNQGYEKEFYRMILGATVIDKNNGYIFVDAVNSSFADYVFEVTNVVNSMEWFDSGGNVQQYFSNSRVNNLKVVIPTLGYLNDGFFLTVDWLKRLEELNSVGKPVIIYGGTLSTMVGKYLFSLFNSSGNDVKVFIQGSLVFARNGLSQLTGVQGQELADICIFNLNSSSTPILNAFKSKIKFRVVSNATDLVLR